MPTGISGLSQQHAGRPGGLPATEPVHQQDGSAPSTAPLWLEGQGAATQDRFRATGLRNPRAAGDIAALLARVAMDSDEQEGISRGNRLMKDFASKAGALATTEMKEQRARVNALREFAYAGENVLARNDEKISPLLAEMSSEEARIAEAAAQISVYNTLLSNPLLTPAERENLEQLLQAAQAMHDGALAARDSVAIELAQATILMLAEDMKALGDYYETLAPDSPERGEIAAMLTGRAIEINSAQQELSAFIILNPKPVVARNAFASGTSARASGVLGEIAVRQERYEEKLDDQTSALVVDTANALISAARRTAMSRQAQAEAVAGQNGRDHSSERLFEMIHQGIAEIDARLRETWESTDDRLADRRMEDDAARMEELSARLRNLLSLLLSSLAHIDIEPVATLQPAVNSRMRVGL